MVVGAWTEPEEWLSDLAKEEGWSSSEAHCQEADSSLGSVAGGEESPQHLLQLLVDLVELGFQFLAVGMIDGGGKALDQILEFDVAQVLLHRSIRLLDAGIQSLGPKDQRVLEKLRLALRQAKSIAFFREVDHGG